MAHSEESWKYEQSPPSITGCIDKIPEQYFDGVDAHKAVYVTTLSDQDDNNRSNLMRYRLKKTIQIGQESTCAIMLRDENGVWTESATVGIVPILIYELSDGTYLIKTQADKCIHLSIGNIEFASQVPDADLVHERDVHTLSKEKRNELLQLLQDSS